MSFEERILSEKEVVSLLEIEENHFNDFKSKDTEGKKLSRTISAFANASGGDVYVGIREENGFFRNYPLLLLYPMYLNFASSNCLPHLPYIVRFIIFNLLLVPSTNPLL